jgi:hypothetical protein
LSATRHAVARLLMTGWVAAVQTDEPSAYVDGVRSFLDFRLFDVSPDQGTASIRWRTSMSRYQFGAQPYPVLGDQNREIGLRAVAAAVLYQGEACNVERMLSREPSVPTVPATPSSDREP